MKTPTQSTTHVKTQRCARSEQTGVSCSCGQCNRCAGCGPRRRGERQAGGVTHREGPDQQGPVWLSTDKGKAQRGLASVLRSQF